MTNLPEQIEQWRKPLPAGEGMKKPEYVSSVSEYRDSAGVGLGEVRSIGIQHFS